jgi:hypothetical protein
VNQFAVDLDQLDTIANTELGPLADEINGTLAELRGIEDAKDTFGSHLPELTALAGAYESLIGALVSARQQSAQSLGELAVSLRTIAGNYRGVDDSLAR